MNAATLASADPVLALLNLSHSYGDRRVLDAFSLELRAGEIVGLLGPNGSGKSTIISLLAGLIPSRSGEFRVGGRRVEQAARELRERLGVVFQAASLDVRLSVRENLRLAAAMRGLMGRVGADRVELMLDAVRLVDRGDEVVGKLSGGMRRRIDIARALLHQPELLVLDEPSSGLDERSFRDLWATLLDLRDATGLAILVATHRPDEAEHCGRLIVLAGGRTVAELTPDALRARVDGDLVTLTVSADANDVAQRIASLGDSVQVVGDAVQLRCPPGAGPAVIPRIFQVLPVAPLEVALRRPSLADAFYSLTGEQLG